MLKEHFKIRIRSVHVLAALFLLYIFYVGLAPLPQFLIHTGKTFQEELGSSYIQKINSQYEGMLSTEAQYPLLQNKGTYIHFNGLMAKTLRQPLMNDRVMLKNGHLGRLVSEVSSQEAIRRAADNIIRFHNAHTSQGKNFLFVMVPSQISKYEDLLPPGYTDTTNADADAFLALLDDAGVPYLDLREELQAEGISVTDAYYVTDHHWTPQTGFWAYQKMVSKLEQMGAIAPVDPFYTDPENFTFETHPDSFLGSSGKRTGKYYAGVDDSVLIRPNFETDIRISVPERQLELQGRFEDVAYNTEAVHNYADPDFFQENVYGLYGWGDTQITHWRNAPAPEQSRFLLIGESFGNIPFSLMSIVFGSCDEMDLRYYQEDFPDYYGSYQPDTVIVLVNVDNTLSEFTDEYGLSIH